MAVVVHLGQRRSAEVIKALEQLLALAKRGQAFGLVYVIKVAHRQHRAGVVGDYSEYPEEALSATFRLERHLTSWAPPFD